MNENLLPREHGAYGQLLFPLLSGLLMGHPGPASWALSAAAVFFFLAYEPLAILLGIRGTRAQRSSKTTARRALAVLVPAGLAAGVAAWVTSPAEARLLIILPLAPAVLLIPLIVARRAKTLPGEVVVAGTFAAMHAPVAHAAGVRGMALWGPAVVWFLVFVLSTLTVHALKDRQAGRKTALAPITDGALMVALLATLVIASKPTDTRPLALAALAPVAALVVVNFGRITARQLNRIGWALIAGSAAALVVLTLGL